MTSVSLCILTCNQVAETQRLIESIRVFEGLDVEVVIGDNSTRPEARAAFKTIADTYLEIPDERLWYEGFGPCRQKIVNAASNPWVVNADPDEVWSQVGDPVRLLTQAVQWNYVVLRALMDAQMPPSIHPRIFDRRAVRWLGMIHEEPYHRRSMASWLGLSLKIPFATIDHCHREETAPAYAAAKRTLYENLLHRAYENPELRHGTNAWWFSEYWPAALARGFVPATFKEWQCMREGL